jgi:hypothetical protein
VARAGDVKAAAIARWSLVLPIATIAVMASASRDVQAQRTNRPPTPRAQPELRADFVDARVPAAHVGVGVSVPASTYVRLGIVAAVGQAWPDGRRTAAGRIDGLARFVVDPQREFRWAPYASGGVGAIYDGEEHWRGVLIGALGIEGPASGHIVPAFEVGFGGGVRVGIGLRRAMAGRR